MNGSSHAHIRTYTLTRTHTRTRASDLQFFDSALSLRKQRGWAQLLSLGHFSCQVVLQLDSWSFRTSSVAKQYIELLQSKVQTKTIPIVALLVILMSLREEGRFVQSWRQWVLMRALRLLGVVLWGIQYLNASSIHQRWRNSILHLLGWCLFILMPVTLVSVVICKCKESL